MARKVTTAHAGRISRHRRVRNKVYGTPERPRLCVFRSLKYIYAQVIDDVQGHTLAAATSLDLEVRAGKDSRNKTSVSAQVGTLLAQRARERGVSQVVFDRGGYKYHGRVKALAQAAREGGLVF